MQLAQMIACQNMTGLIDCWLKILTAPRKSTSLINEINVFAHTHSHTRLICYQGNADADFAVRDFGAIEYRELPHDWEGSGRTADGSLGLQSTPTALPGLTFKEQLSVNNQHVSPPSPLPLPVTVP